MWCTKRRGSTSADATGAAARSGSLDRTRPFSQAPAALCLSPPSLSVLSLSLSLSQHTHTRLRPSPPPPRYDPEVSVKPRKLRMGLLSWVAPTLSYPEDEVMAVAGLDVVVFLRLLRYGLALFAFATFWCCALLVPINATVGGVGWVGGGICVCVYLLHVRLCVCACVRACVCFADERARALAVHARPFERPAPRASPPKRPSPNPGRAAACARRATPPPATSTCCPCPTFPTTRRATSGSGRT